MLWQALTSKAVDEGEVLGLRAAGLGERKGPGFAGFAGFAGQTVGVAFVASTRLEPGSQN